MPDDVVADRGDLFIGVCVGEWRHRVVATKRSDPDAFKYGADNICAGGVIFAARGPNFCLFGFLTNAVPPCAGRANSSQYPEDWPFALARTLLVRSGAALSSRQQHNQSRA